MCPSVKTQSLAWVSYLKPIDFFVDILKVKGQSWPLTTCPKCTFEIENSYKISHDKSCVTLAQNDLVGLQSWVKGQYILHLCHSHIV